MIFWLIWPFECLILMNLTVAKYHENLLKGSTLSLLSIVKFFSPLKTKMILKTPNETFLRITWYVKTVQWTASNRKVNHGTLACPLPRVVIFLRLGFHSSPRSLMAKLKFLHDSMVLLVKSQSYGESFTRILHIALGRMTLESTRRVLGDIFRRDNQQEHIKTRTRTIPRFLLPKWDDWEDRQFIDWTYIRLAFACRNTDINKS